MEVMDVIAKRRSVRDYTDTRVEGAMIERLINAATLAPSERNGQPWAFAVLLDRGRIDNYANRAKSWLLANLSQTSHPASIRKRLEDPNFILFHHAPALVLVLAKSSDGQAKEDCCLAAENLMLAARSEGLGTCWISLAHPWLNLSSTKLELGLPEPYQVVAPIVLGYPKAWPESRGRNPAEIYVLG